LTRALGRLLLRGIIILNIAGRIGARGGLPPAVERFLVVINSSNSMEGGTGMATWGPFTITGSGGAWVAGGGTTNHEAFAVEPTNAANDVGAELTQVVVFNETDFFGATPTYLVLVQVTDLFGNPTNNTVTVLFNSNGV
jgi:hypothetical protein